MPRSIAVPALGLCRMTIPAGTVGSRCGGLGRAGPEVGDVGQPRLPLAGAKEPLSKRVNSMPSLFVRFRHATLPRLLVA